jgi:Zn-dependent M32 family carboxypeptidase
VTDTGAPAQTNIFITHLDEVEAFLRKDADTHMPPGSTANRALQIDAIGKTRDFLTAGFATIQGAYQNLRDRFAILSRLAEIQQTMVMDAEPFMPADEAPHRQHQMTNFGTVSNLLIADPQVENGWTCPRSTKRPSPPRGYHIEPSEAAILAHTARDRMPTPALRLAAAL